MSLLPFGRNNLRQSHVPEKIKTASHFLVRQPQTAQTRSAQTQGRSPLTFSQAITITAGMAGLVGLLSGVLVRFSLANSSNARFLSPLQTFPELSDWSSDSTPDVADAQTRFPERSPEGILEESSPDLWQSPDELDWNTDTRDFDTFSSESFTDAQSTTELTIEDGEGQEIPFIESEGAPTSGRAVAETDTQNFDTFANRVEGQRQVESIDPFKALSRGPLLRKSTLEPLPGESGLSESDFRDRGADAEGVSSPYESTSQAPSLSNEEYDNIEYEPFSNDVETELPGDYESGDYEAGDYEAGDYEGSYENESW